MELSNYKYLILSAIIVTLFISSCDINKSKITSNNESGDMYCEEELRLISSSLRHDELTMNIDTIHSLRHLSDVIKSYYNIDCKYNSIKRVGFTFSLNADTFNLGGEDNTMYVFCGFSHVCMSDTIIKYPTPSRDFLYKPLLVDSSGTIIDLGRSYGKSESEILNSNFTANAEIKIKKTYKVSMIDEITIYNLKMVINKVILSYLVNIDEYSKMKYSKELCYLNDSDFKELVKYNSLNIEISLQPTINNIIVVPNLRNSSSR